ncbi:MAG: RNA 2',3'-cyclic phosphodiesterase [Patescibacteria group bacterium]|nr:RNA 2',3'-cyclic phosphodiesterase [Patescibacteria group bacterium]
MKTKRIFIAINLPNKIKDELSRFQDALNELPVKWIKKDNLHITLSFIGKIDDNQILEVGEIVKNIVADYNKFFVNLIEIDYGPKNIFPPRMIWATIGDNSALREINKNLEKSLKLKNDNFFPHITLGRINQWQYKKIEPEERQEIKQDIDLNFKVKSIDIMESKLSPRQAKYNILRALELK